MEVLSHSGYVFTMLSSSLLFPLINLHRQRNTLLRNIHIQNLHLNDVPDSDCLKRMLDETVCDLGNVYQPVLMYSDIHEHTEINNIAHCTFKNHAGL